MEDTVDDSLHTLPVVEPRQPVVARDVVLLRPVVAALVVEVQGPIEPALGQVDLDLVPEARGLRPEVEAHGPVATPPRPNAGTLVATRPWQRPFRVRKMTRVPLPPRRGTFRLLSWTTTAGAPTPPSETLGFPLVNQRVTEVTYTEFCPSHRALYLALRSVGAGAGRGRGSWAHTLRASHPPSAVRRTPRPTYHCSLHRTPAA